MKRDRVVPIVLGVVAVAIVGFLTVVLPLEITRGVRMPLQRSLADIGVRNYEEVELTPRDQAITLRGWWLPAERARAAIVVVHGGGGNKSDPWTKIPELLRDLNARGWAVLAIDMRNHGASDSSLDGRTSFGPAEAEDVIGAVDYLAKRVPTLPVAALGFSMGGNAVIYAAARDPRIIAAITTGTYAEAGPVLPDAIKAASGLPRWICSAGLWSLETFYGVAISKVRAVDEVGKLAPGSLLVIHNEADPIVPFGHAWMLASAATDADMWVTEVPQQDDSFYRDAGPWGTHVKEYRLRPQDYVDHVVAHIERQLEH